MSIDISSTRLVDVHGPAWVDALVADLEQSGITVVGTAADLWIVSDAPSTGSGVTPRRADRGS